MAISEETVKYVAHLARIQLKESQLKTMAEQLEDILKFIDKLKELDIKDIKPTSHILPITNVLREDDLKASLSLEEVLEDAPQRKNNFFAVPKIIE